MNTKSLFNRIIPLSIVLLVAGFVTATMVRAVKQPFYDDQESAQESEWLSYIKLVADENDGIIEKWSGLTKDTKMVEFLTRSNLYNKTIYEMIKKESEWLDWISAITEIPKGQLKKDLDWDNIDYKTKEELFNGYCKDTSESQEFGEKFNKESDDIFFNSLQITSGLKKDILLKTSEWENLNQAQKSQFKTKISRAILETITHQETDISTTKYELDLLMKIAKHEKISPKEANTKYRWNDLDHSGRLIVFLSIINNLNDSESDAPSTNPGEMEKKDEPETLEVQGETGWRGGQGRGRVGTGLRDSIGADSGIWYDTGLDWGRIENMAKQRARQNGHPRQWNSYLWRSMREP